MGNCCTKICKKTDPNIPRSNVIYVEDLLKEEEEQPYKNVFEEVDEDGDGKLNEEELGIAIDRLIGYKPSINILKQLILASDKCKSGKIEFPEFFALVRSWSFLSDSEKNARKAFADFDKDSDGYITVDEMQIALKSLKVQINNEDLIRLVDECVDQNIDRRIDRGEFLTMYQRISEATPITPILLV